MDQHDAFILQIDRQQIDGEAYMMTPITTYLGEAFPGRTDP
jgi:hypothetical protein